MIVRNIDQKEVQRGFYQAHGGGLGAMLFDSSVLQGILFLATGTIRPGNVVETHIDPYEEIYYFLEGEGTMEVDGERQRVGVGDAVWVPYGSAHGFVNDGNSDCRALVIAAMPRA